MKDLVINKTVQTVPWFKEWFNASYYHKLYAHRSDEEAAGFINALLNLLQPVPGSKMLDVGCGNGRHCRQLAKNYPVTGIDIAPASIMEAKRLSNNIIPYYNHDMRLPFAVNTFDYVFNFFTSFGYFEDEATHKMVLDNMKTALKPGGILVLDYLNVYKAEKELIAAERKEIDGIIYHITRWMDDRYFYKEIIVDDPSVAKPLVYTEQVARFSLYDFQCMFDEAGLRLLGIYGDYELHQFNKKNSPRLILIAENS